jgi:uncharacterized protein
MTNVQSSGIDAAQRRLNGPQTTGRNYRNLSQPTFEMANDDDVVVPVRDGVTFLADVHRPSTPGKYPVLIAASPYPRQIQNLGAPAGFIEAGATDSTRSAKITRALLWLAALVTGAALLIPHFVGG